MRKKPKTRKAPRPATVKRRLERAANKERKKVSEAGLNLQLTDLPAFKALHQQVQTLTQGHNNVTGIVNTNTQAFGDAFGMIDMHVCVMQKALDDLMLSKCITYKNGEGKDQIHWSEYKKHYWQCQEFEKFCEMLRAFPIPKEEKPKPAPEPEEAVVFGGDA
jgi:hypothetical protein